MGPSLSSTNILCLLTKYEINGTSSIPMSKLFSDLGKNWKCNLGLYFKKPSLLSFSWFGKNPAKATFKNLKISLLIEKNLEVQPKTNTQKIPIWNPWRNWENLYPYVFHREKLSFEHIENSVYTAELLA